MNHYLILWFSLVCIIAYCSSRKKSSTFVFTESSKTELVFKRWSHVMFCNLQLWNKCFLHFFHFKGKSNLEISLKLFTCTFWKNVEILTGMSRGLLFDFSQVYINILKSSTTFLTKQFSLNWMRMGVSNWRNVVITTLLI